MYTGKGTDDILEDDNDDDTCSRKDKKKDKDMYAYNLGEKVVLQLMEPYVCDNFCVAFDNFFTSMRLLRILFENGIFALGTLRVKRKDMPPIFSQLKKFPKHLKFKGKNYSLATKRKVSERGNFLFTYKKRVSVVKWRDNRDVMLASNCIHPDDVTFVHRKLKDGKKIEVACPAAIRRYNEIMAGVDRSDQLRAYYKLGRKSVKWWHRILYHFIDCTIANAFISFKLVHPNQSVDQLRFRLNLAAQLINGYSSRKKRSGSYLGHSNEDIVPADVRTCKVGIHIPLKIKQWRRCRVCGKNKIEKRTQYMFKKCNVSLCMPNCFNSFHQ